MTLPRALAPFLALAQTLRANRFPVAPEQLQAFIAATGLLGPRSLTDVHRAARATLGSPPDRFDDFDALFRQVFLGQTLAAPALAAADDEETVTAWDAGDQGLAPPEGEEEPSGAEATAAERLAARAFAPGTGLAAFRRAIPAALPRRRSRRLRPAKRGPRPDPRRILRAALAHDGEVVTLPRRRRRTRQRPVLLLIDVSGSMKAETEGYLRIAHALVQAADRIEVFTLGTRLTRVTRALRRRDPEQALAATAGLVADWDGGTRLGEALGAFLAVPRFAGFARGALAVVVSDGLERGGPEALQAAMGKLRGLAWAVLWLSPLAADPDYRPETGALRAILPMLDRLGDGASPASVAGEILAFRKGARLRGSA
jgi:uncharacterized protein